MNRNNVLAERMNRILAYLMSEGMARTKTEIAEKIGTAQPNVSSAFLGNPKVLTRGFMRKLNTAFNGIFNEDWVFTGEGSMLKQQAIEQPQGSPYFDTITVEGGSGMGSGMEQLTAHDAAGFISVPGLKTGSDTPFIQVHGNSMLNRNNPEFSIPNGAWVGLQRCASNVIHWGEVYCLMTTTGPIVKKLLPSDKEDCIKCVSFNTEDGYAPFDLPHSEIIPPLFKIVGVLIVNNNFFF